MKEWKNKEVYMLINLNHLFSLMEPKKVQSTKNAATGTEQQQEKLSRNYTTSQLSAAVLANVTYKKNPKEAEQDLKRIIEEHKFKFSFLPDDFYEKFDYENADRHLSHLQFLIDVDSDMGYSSVFNNGYFYSKDGAEAFDILMNNYSTKKSNNYRDAFSIMLRYDYQKILTARERGLFDNIIKRIETKDATYNKIECLIKLNDEEFNRLKTSGLMEKGIYYASKNNDINKMFINIQQDKNTNWVQNDFKQADVIISALDDDNKIKDVTDKISEMGNKNVLKNIIRNASDNNNVDIEFYANHLDELYDEIHSNIENFEDINFYHSIEDILYLINKDNYDAVKSLIKLKGMNQHLLGSILDYMYTKENAKQVQGIIDKINAGNEDIIALPVYKYAQINPRIAATRNNLLKEYDENTPLSKLEKESKLGDIFAHGNNVYIKDEEKLEKLDLDKNTYKKLFPEYQSLCIQQGNNTGNCYYLSGGLISFWKNPKGRVHLLKMIKQDGNDIVVTIPGLKDYPVRFKNGNIELMENHAKTSLGNLMLEQAYAKARYANENKIKGEVSNINADKAMDYIYGGFESQVFNEITGTKKGMEYIEESYNYSEQKPQNYKYITKENISEILDNYSDLNKYILCMSSGVQDCGYLPEYGIHPKHAYAVENIDTKNKTVTIINPYNSLYTSTISYEQAKNYFSTIAVIEI